MKLSRALFKILLEDLSKQKQLKERQKEAKRQALSQEFNYMGYVLLVDGRLQVFFGTEHNKQGYSVITYDPSDKRKRPNIPQYQVEA